jgi:hypothetical protein
MLDLSKPEIKQAYLMGVEAGKTITANDADRAAQETENRIVAELDRFKSKLEHHDCVVQAGVVAHCLAIINGEVLDV